MRRRLMFADRAEAGRLLALQLGSIDLSDPLVVALPRGGVPVGAEIARALQVPLDVAFVRKLGAPGEPELAIGAVADGGSPEIVLNDEVVSSLAVDEDYIAEEVARELVILEQRRRDYSALRPSVDPAGRSIVVVDDGVATGMTMQAALQHLRRSAGAAQLVAAVPAASRDAVVMLRRQADLVVCLSSPRRFGSVGSFYRSFAQVSDDDVMRLLREAAASRN